MSVQTVEVGEDDALDVLEGVQAYPAWSLFVEEVETGEWDTKGVQGGFAFAEVLGQCQSCRGSG